ncbi:MAG: HRDC domain-containing protein [Planctomycetota bacterium]
MLVSVVTCPFVPARGAFDPEPLHLFTRDKVVVEAREHLVTQGERTWLAVLLTYQLLPPSALDGRSGRLDRRGQERARRPDADDLRQGLAPDVRERFDRLRDWRNAAARDRGIPPYAVLTNRQLLALAEAAPTTRAGLQRVRGLGKQRVARFGAELLALLAPEASAFEANEPATDATAPDPDAVLPFFAAADGSSAP